MGTILIIEDDPDITESLKDLLELSGYKVYTTAKEERINQIIKTKHPNVILLDLLLSGKDGRTICKALKGNAETHMIPVIMMSAHPNAKKEAQMAGANNFIPKPFDGDDMLELISRYVKR